MSKKKSSIDKRYSVSKLTERVPNRFLLTLAIAKRARQIKDGAEPLVDFDDNYSPITIAMKEIEQGKIKAFLEDAKDTKDVTLDDISDYLDPENLEKIEKKSSESKKPL